MSPRAVVLLSGGMDSTTALAMTRKDGFELIALTFDYGQRHRKEIEAATRIVRTIAGNGTSGPGGDRGPAEQAGLARPHGAVVAPDGRVFIGDSENHRVRVLTRAA